MDSFGLIAIVDRHEILGFFCASPLIAEFVATQAAIYSTFKSVSTLEFYGISQHSKFYCT